MNSNGYKETLVLVNGFCDSLSHFEKILIVKFQNSCIKTNIVNMNTIEIHVEVNLSMILLNYNI